MAETEALNAGTVFAEMVLKMEKFDAAMVSLQSALKSIDAQVEQTKRKFDFSNLSKGIDNVGKRMSMAFTLPFSIVSFAAIGETIKESVKNASDLNETVSKTSTIFGSGSRDMISWGKGAAQSLGMSERVALDSASSFALFAKQAGLSGQAVNNFSKDNVKMAADLASFFNTSPEEAIGAIGSAFRGESEPIRKYNVLLDDASLRQEAFKKHITSTTSQALTPQQRILAAQSLILKQTSSAQGDFAKTADQLANQQRIQSAEMENVTASLGTKLLPIMLAVKKEIVEGLTWVDNLSDGTKKAIVIVGSVAVAGGPVLVILAKLIAGVSGAIAIFTGLKAAITGATLATNAGRTAQIAYTVATRGASIATAAFNAVLKANPLAKIISLAATAASALGIYALVCGKATERQQEFNDARSGKVKIGEIDSSAEQQLEKEYASIMKIEDGKVRGEKLAELKRNSQNEINALLEREKAIRVETDAIEKGTYSTAGKSLNDIRSKVEGNAKAEIDIVNRIGKLKQQIAFANLKLETAQTDAEREKKAADEEWLRNRKAALADLRGMETQAANDELITEGARYEKDLEKYKDYIAKGVLWGKQAEDYLASVKAIHSQKGEELSKKAAEANQNAWKSSLDTTSTDFASKFSQINALSDNFATTGQKTAMTFAAAFTSAIAAVSNLFSAMIQAQQTEIENKYSTLSAAEQEYVNYQDAEDAKAYTKMSAKEKKEHNLKAASDKAEKKREAEKAAALKKLQKQQAALNLVNALATIGVSTAMGVMNIWSNPMNNSPFEAYRGMMTAFVLGLGATEAAAAITAAAPAMATGGLVRSKSGGSNIIAGEAGYDEYVVPDTNVVMNGIANRILSSLKSAAGNAADSARATAQSAGNALSATAQNLTVILEMDKIAFGRGMTQIMDQGYATVPARVVV